jgi:hypothetical protein
MDLTPAILCGFLIFMPGCDDRQEELVADTMAKVEIDLNSLDKEGLRGPPDGKVSVAYEFAIPNTGECKEEVRRIDPSVEFMPGSRGRVGAGNGKCLCIGSTHRQDYRAVLRSLSELPYIDRIIECHFE